MGAERIGWSTRNPLPASMREGEWQVGGRLHREFECEGPVRVRLSSGPGEPSRLLGPFRLLRTRGGVLYGDDACLNISMPGRSPRANDASFPMSVTFERGPDEK